MMEYTEEIKQEKTETLPEEKKDDIFFTMLNGQTVKETFTTSRGDFVIKFPKQGDLITIARQAAFLRMGFPAQNFDSSGEYEIQKCATLDVTVDSGPAWFNKLKKDPNFSWRDMPDAHFTDEVYTLALSFRATVQEKLKGNQGDGITGTTEEVSGGVPADVGNGAFQGITRKVTRGRSQSA
jgi:hypothetical protein